MQIRSRAGNRKVEVPLMITTVVAYSTTGKTLVGMVNRLCNKFPGMILPERQSAQLVLSRQLENTGNRIKFLCFHIIK